MSDGEGFRCRTSETPSPDALDDELEPLDVDRKIDSPVSSSRYSSCGESEFERYCSANSVMGTPSLCSSVGAFNDCVDSDFGESTRSFGTGEEEFGLEGFSLGGRFAGKHDDEGRVSTMSKSNVKSSSSGNGFHCVGLGEEIVDEKVGKEDLGVLLNNVENVLKEGATDLRGNSMFDDVHADDSPPMRRGNELVVHGGLGGKSLQRTMDTEERDDDGHEERDGISSRFEHSDGEDSMFNSGSDGDGRFDAYYMRNSHGSHEVKSKGGNMILMGSSVAFGSNDWEDFELERTENDSSSQMFNESWHEELNSQNGFNQAVFSSLPSQPLGNMDAEDQNEAASNVPSASDEGHGVLESPKTSVGNSVDSKSREKPVVETTKDASFPQRKTHSDDESIEYLEECQVYNIFEKPNPLSHVGSTNSIVDKESCFGAMEQANGFDDNQLAENKDLCDQEQLVPPSDMMFGQESSSAKDIFEDLAAKSLIEDEKPQFSNEHKLNSLSSRSEGNMERFRIESNQTEAKLPPSKDKSVELNAFYDEVVHDMEEILLESADSFFTRQNQGSQVYHSHQPSPLRDDGSTASTSGAVGGYPLNSQHTKIDGVQVVGAKQKRGDISLSERLVGVKEHTVYVIRVWSGEEQWEVERRYRDFYTLYRRLKSFFADQGWLLPSSWSAVEWESRKIFGNSSPDVVSERSALIEECLHSVLQFSYPSGLPNALVWFLSPPKALPGLQSNSPNDFSAIESNAENISTLGNTISLIVDIRPHKSTKQVLEEQHSTCPGCHKQLDGNRSRFEEFVQTFGLKKPRLCEYTGLLFCSSCHTNDTAVLPARVLHHWDFTQYPVSQLAKFYLDSIIDQPMLCVSAVNPFLLSKVKVLLHVVTLRRKIRALLEFVHCPFRGSIYRGLGSRRYLLESTDFFSLRNLIDLSRGAFAVLPMVLEAILKKIEEHITEQCLVCCDVGVPCSARQSCDDISSLIFPFQDEDEVRKCGTCKSPFHKRCFGKLTECPCGTPLEPDTVKRSTSASDGALSLFRMKSDLGLTSSSGFLSKLLSSERQENPVKDHHQQQPNNVILMGSLPGNST